MVSEIFNECINGTGEIPSEWTQAWITPIYKKGDRKICNNYMGISVTSTIANTKGENRKGMERH